MDAWYNPNSPRRRSATNRRGPQRGSRAGVPWRVWPLVIALIGSLAVGYVVYHVSGWAAPTQTAAQQRAARAGIAGTASLSGTVTSAKPFKAAQVYIRNVDKAIGYMVYTNAGQFRSIALLPGNYEVTVKTPGLESDVQKLALKAGDNQNIKLSLRDVGTGAASGGAALGNAESGSIAGSGTGLTFQSYDEIYPPNGPGKQVAEQVCMACHGENFFPTQPASEAV